MMNTETHYQDLFHTLPAGFALHEVLSGATGQDYRLLAVNPAFAQLSGLPAEALIGQKVRAVLSAPVWQALYAQLASDGPPVSHYFPNAARYYQATAFTPAPGQLALLLTDITVAKREEIRVRDSETQYRRLVDDMPFMVCRFLPNTQIIFVNHHYCGYFGLPCELLQGQQFLQFIPPAEREAVLSHFQSFTPDNAIQTQEHPVIGSDGEIRWQRWINRAFFDEQGNVTEFQAVGEDITETKRISKTLRHELALNSALARLYKPLVAAETSMREISEDVLTEACRLTGSEHGYVAEVEPENNNCIVHTFTAMLEREQCGVAEEQRHVVFMPDFRGQYAGLWGHALNIRQSFYTNQPQIHPATNNRVPDGHIAIQRFLSVPVLLGDRLVGQIAVANAGRNYNNEDINTVEWLGEFYALAIQRLRMEEALQFSEKRHRELVESLPSVVYTYSDRRGALYWSPAVKSILGYTPEDLIHDAFLWHDSVHPDDTAKVNQAVCDSYAGKGFEVEYRIRDKSGEWHWFLDRFVSKRVENEEIIIKGIATDISARKKIETELKRLATIVEQAAVSVVMTDPEAKIIYANPHFETATGYRREEVLGRNPRILQSGRQDSTFYLQLWKTLLAGKTWSGRFVNKRKDGSLFHEEATIFPVKNSAGETVNYVSVKYDISKQVVAEDALEQERAMLAKRVTERTAELSRTNAELSRAVKLKDEFLAVMSHELRTPLNSILTLSEVLEEMLWEGLTDKQRKYFRILRESADHLLTLINDVLDISKIGAGRMQLEIGAVPVQSLCESGLRLVKQLAAKKNQQLCLTSDPEVATIDADVRRLKQILVNLLSNAVKFTPEGGKIELCFKGDKAAGVVHFSVTDTGIGIAGEDLPRLFQPFTQLDSGLARQFSGTGLGLTLVAKMAKLHGGSVRVDSTPGKGSCFTVTLPWRTEAFTVIPVEDPRPVPALSTPDFDSHDLALPTGLPRILVVDDMDASRELLVEYFSLRGCQASGARSGPEAVEQSRLLRPEVILMDIQMPDMDGIETTHQIRRDPALAHTVIIALTALAMPGDKERCMQAGMQAYVSKPVSLKKLTTIIVGQLQRRYMGA